jgi:hypothetical protein
MEDLKLLLIDRLKSKGMDLALIPAFLEALIYIISFEPEINLIHATRKIHSLDGMKLRSITTPCRMLLLVLKQTQDTSGFLLGRHTRCSILSIGSLWMMKLCSPRFWNWPALVY